MPVHPVYRCKGKHRAPIGYQWGRQSVYRVSEYGKSGALMKAREQEKAIHAQGRQE